MTESCIFKYFFLLLLQFWYEMAGKEMELCAVLDVRLQDLLTLCDEQDQKIKDLSETIRQMKEEYRILNVGHADCHKHCLCRWRREKRGEATVVGISS